MLVIIDGYNLLKKIIKSSFATEKQINSFISEINKYILKKKHEAIIVFDGFDSNFKSLNKNLLKVVYSKNETADDYIKDYVDNHQLTNAILVSSDRELAKYVLKKGIPVIGSLDFYYLMQKSDNLSSLVKIKKSKGQAIKLNKSSESTENMENAELDKLMQQGANMVMHKQEDQEVDQKNLNNKSNKTGNKLRSRKKRSKEEKSILKIIKKL